MKTPQAHTSKTAVTTLPPLLPLAVLQAVAQAPASALVVGRGMGWRCVPSAAGLYLYLGRSQVSHWTVPRGLRAVVLDRDGEDFFRIYLAADGSFADEAAARRAVGQAAASLRALSPRMRYRVQGLRSWSEKQRPRVVVKKAQ